MKESIILIETLFVHVEKLHAFMSVTGRAKQGSSCQMTLLAKDEMLAELTPAFLQSFASLQRLPPFPPIAKGKYKDTSENNVKPSCTTGKHTEYLSAGYKHSQVRDQRSVLLSEINNFNPVSNPLPNATTRINILTHASRYRLGFFMLYFDLSRCGLH